MLLFSKEDYEVLIDGDIMIFKPRRYAHKVLLITPPFIKPQLYSILAILLAKDGLEVRLPIKPLPCSAEKTQELVESLGHEVDLVLNLGIPVRGNNVHTLSMSYEAATRLIKSSYTPGVGIALPIEECLEALKHILPRDGLGEFNIELVLRIRDEVKQRLGTPPHP